MAKYAISIREILKRTVIVDAENIDEAIEKVNIAIEQDKIILDVDDYDDREIIPSEYFGNGSGEINEEEDVSFYWHLENDNAE